MSESNGCLSITIKLLAAILVIIFILALPLGLLALNTSSLIFSPENLSRTLTERLVHSGALRRSIAEYIPQSQFFEDMGRDSEIFEAFKNLDTGEWERVLDILLPPEWMEKQFKESFEAISRWLEDDSFAPIIEFDLRPIKARVQGGGAIEIVEMVVDSWPSCTTTQVERMRQTLTETGEVLILLCEPPEPYREQLVQLATRQFRIYVRDIPNTFSSVRDQPPVQETERSLQLKERIRLVRALSFAGWLLPLALLGLIMVLAIRSWRDLAIWWGIPILLAGILTMALGLSGESIGQRYILPSLEDLRREAEPLYNLTITALVGMRDEIFGNIFGQALLISFLGGALILFGWFLSRITGQRTPRQRPPASGPPPPVQKSEAEPVAPHPPPPPVSSMPEDADEKERPSGIFG
ncbi:MAG: hypothetical protein GTO14_22170 [Anaerolineales bacterium]|nr:hypothetical protein [Anaerolineales bacterium]